MCDKSAGRFFWKGKHVTEKTYNLRLQRTVTGKNLRSVYGCTQSRKSEKSKEESNLKDKQVEPKIEGRRIVHVQTLGKQMVCRKCSQTLSLCNIVDEKLVGLACIWIIQCEHCSCTTRVATDETHKSKMKTKQGKEMYRYDVNVAGAMATLNTGSGNSHLNKILSSFDIPIFHPNSYKLHENEVGAVAEEMAREECMQATLLERELTIKNIRDIQKLL